jgi:hypothetical protein
MDCRRLNPVSPASVIGRRRSFGEKGLVDISTDICLRALFPLALQICRMFCMSFEYFSIFLGCDGRERDRAGGGKTEPC